MFYTVIFFSICMPLNINAVSHLSYLSMTLNYVGHLIIVSSIFINFQILVIGSM